MTDILEITSEHLERKVRADIYRPANIESPCSLLLINDGQDLPQMDFETMLMNMHDGNVVHPMVAVGVHCGADRHQEYGMSAGPDYKGWGGKAAAYERFIIKELLPVIVSVVGETNIRETSIAGFSLGGLSAFDIAWNNPDVFSKVGVFSGSFWWRSVDKVSKRYDPWKHRMMHHQVATSAARPGMKFFFECGEHDEEEDRNKNGVIDSIDDTIDLMQLLVEKGYREGKDFFYLQMPEGRHDVPSWGKAMPLFLRRMFGRPKAVRQ